MFLFSGILAAGRLVPAVRWYFRQRADKVVEAVRRRSIELPTFKLTRRGILIYRLTHDPELLEAAELRPAGPSDGASCSAELRGGEWAYVWPLGRLIGGMGAYFVRQLVEAERGVYRPAPGAEKFLVYYANSAYR